MDYDQLLVAWNANRKRQDIQLNTIQVTFQRNVSMGRLALGDRGPDAFAFKVEVKVE